MVIKCFLRGFLLFTLLAATAACSSLPTGPRDLFDERTGVTTSLVGAPLEFDHESNGATAHDSLTPEAGSGELLIDVDGRSIDLQPLPRLPVGLPQPKDLFVPDTTDGAMRAYVTDLETLRLIATSHELTVRLPKESPIGSYTVWHDGRAALGEFVRHLSGS